MKRFSRILPRDRGYFVHVISRIVDRRFVLGDVEKATFRRLQENLASFCGLTIVTYALMDNHFHLLLEVPQRKTLSDAEILKRLGFIWSKGDVAGARQRLEKFKAYSTQDAYLREREIHLRRMYDLGQFMKALKQQFTRWYNRRNQRTGTLWEARYKSVVVGSDEALLAMAGYIDLNAVRAGICSDPMDYRWCGYGEAMAGLKPARDGLKRIAEVTNRSLDWRMVLRMYRQYLYAAGEAKGMDEQGNPATSGFSKEAVLKVRAEGGAVSLPQLLRCRIRYFTDGVAIGSRSFIESLFEECKDSFGANRRAGGSRVRESGDAAFYVIRNLQDDVFS